MNADRARKKGNTGELDALCQYDERLPAIERRLAFLASVQFDAGSAKRRDKTHKQRHKLGRLPKDWLLRVHRQSKTGIYGEAFALGILVPVRPSEIAQRVCVMLDASGAMTFEIKGSKVRAKGSGIAAHVSGIGQPVRWITLSAVDPARQEVFDWLHDRLKTNNGELSIGAGLSSRGISSAFRAMSRRIFPRYKHPPSIYSLRHAACAELKATNAAKEVIALGIGHSSTGSQKLYGAYGQGSGKYIFSARGLNPIREKYYKKANINFYTQQSNSCEPSARKLSAY